MTYCLPLLDGEISVLLNSDAYVRRAFVRRWKADAGGHLPAVVPVQVSQFLSPAEALEAKRRKEFELVGKVCK